MLVLSLDDDEADCDEGVEDEEEKDAREAARAKASGFRQ